MNQDEPSIPEAKAAKPKLPVKVHLMCGWPLILVLVGGLIGGAIGGAAYGLNLAIYGSNLATPVKVGLNILVGLAAFGLWFVIILLIRGGLK